MRYLVVLCLFLTGCVSEHTVLKNPETGQTKDCSAWGFGIIGAPVAMAQHSDCVKAATAAGYTQ